MEINRTVKKTTYNNIKQLQNNMNTHESYVSLATAKRLKQAGFDWEIRDGYIIYGNGHGFTTELQTPHNFNGNNGDLFINYGGHKEVLSRPTLDVAQRWLRENKEFDINILTDFDSLKRLYYVRYVVKDGHYKTHYMSNNQSYVYFNTYEEAQEAGIKKALEMILKKGE